MEDAVSLEDPFIEDTDYQWLLCALWDDTVLGEFKFHHENGNALYTKRFLGKMFTKSIARNAMEDPFAISSYTKSRAFALVDLCDGKIENLGDRRCLLVKETASWNSSQGFTSSLPKMWNLIIYPECFKLVEEMIKLKLSGVKTTLGIWNCVLVRYTNPRIDGDVEILGDIQIKDTTKPEKVLTVVAFYHERVKDSKNRPNVQEASIELPGDLIQKYVNYKDGTEKCEYGEEHFALFFAQPNREDDMYSVVDYCSSSPDSQQSHQ